MITIPTKTLKALIHIAATKDIRFYLVGIHLTQGPLGTILEATNGHMAARVRIDTEPKPNFKMILPLDTVKTAIKTAGAKIDLVVGENGQSVLETIGAKYPFFPIDGVFPDMSRVYHIAPSAVLLKDPDNAPVQLNPDYLQAMHKAGQALSGTKKDTPQTYVTHSSVHRMAVIHFTGYPDALGLIMALRMDSPGTYPEWINAANHAQ